MWDISLYSSVFIANFEQTPFSSFSIADFEILIVC